MSTSSEAANINLVRMMVTEVQQNGNFDLIDKYISPNWIDRTPVMPEQHTSRAGVHWAMRYLHQCMSAIEVEIVHCVCTGDIVATNKVMRGTQDEAFFGLDAIGERVEFRIFDVMRVDGDGMLCEHWGQPGPVNVISKK
jgi:predicted SnoaL-like aldol condensation-catalyzing enzyme